MRRPSVILLLLAVSCGDPLVSTDYRGEPILRIKGEIASLGRGSIDTKPGQRALVSMFWNTDLSRVPPKLVPQDSVSAAIQFPSTFEIRVFDPPQAMHLVRSDGRFGIGLLLVYIDADDDSRYGPDEKLIGGNLDKAIVWAREAIPARQSPFPFPLPEGFSLVKQPFNMCRPPPVDGPEVSANPRPDETTHVRGCNVDEECSPDFECDLRFFVCAPRESFGLTIEDGFDLSHAQCKPN